MWEFGVNWTSQNFTSKVSELFSSIAESNDFCWTYESKIKWIEEKNNVFSFEVSDADVDELSVGPSWSNE